MADSADLFVHRFPTEEAQTGRGHCNPPGDGLERKYRERQRRETQSSIQMPPISDQRNQPVIAPTLARGDRLARLTSQLDAISSFRNPGRSRGLHNYERIGDSKGVTMYQGRKEQGVSQTSDFRCLPDTVDPHGPKRK